MSRMFIEGDLFHCKITRPRAKLGNTAYKYVMVPKNHGKLTRNHLLWEHLYEPHADYNRMLYVTNDIILGR